MNLRRGRKQASSPTAERSAAGSRPRRGRAAKRALTALAALGLLLTIAAAVAAPVEAAAAHCEAGESPQFRFGFAFLKSQIGDTMGEPIECEHGNPDNGDTLQQTTTGLAFYRQYTNTPTFTNGWDHWAWTTSGLVYWAGNSADPPDVFVPTPTPSPTPTVDELPAPLAAIDEPAGDVSVLRGTVLNVRGHGIAAPGLQINGYSWGFNGVEVSGSPSFTWVVDEPGIFTLKVRDDRGVWSETAASVSVQIDAPTPTPTPRPDQVAEAYLAVDVDCDWNWSLGPTNVVTSFPDDMGEQWCLVAQVNFWPSDSGYLSRWHFGDGSIERTDFFNPCPQIACGPGWIRDTWFCGAGAYQCSLPEGDGFVELEVDGVVVKTVAFSIGAAVTTPLDPGGGSLSAPSDLQAAIEFLAGYHSQVPRMDEIVATLSAMTDRTSYQAMPPNFLGSYSGGWITLNTDLQSETLAVVAMVLAHEGQHALDDLNGLLGPGQACYDAEVRAFTVQVLLWSSIYGIDGKPAPLTGIEGNFNFFLDQFLRSPLTFVETIISLYGEQCG
ncbi:MAG: hypothetical protein QF719_01215 [Chloroflexota bacterium]|jgi:hypothetical protein|nr:hypothetical protein [Chloroflexota bacterium]MDP6756828.1 hypothetical protein [Chloroflexota bacterium]